MGSGGTDVTAGEASSQTTPARSRLARVGAILAVVVPPVGLVVSLVAIRRIRRKRQLGRGSAIFGVVCGAVLTVPGLLLLVVAVKSGIFGGNAAQHEAHAFVASVQRAGGRKVCDNGDGGFGPDNRQPWYQVYIDIADRPGLTDEIRVEAARAGYPLEQDAERIAGLKSEQFGPKFNPKADYLVGRSNGNRLEVTIERDTAVPLYCRAGHYGRRRQTGPDDAIVSIDMELPDR